jgi:hypothetical protein
MNYFDQHGICQRCGNVAGNDIASVHTCTPTQFWRDQITLEWNAAIDAASRVPYGTGDETMYYQIRELKK